MDFEPASSTKSASFSESTAASSRIPVFTCRLKMRTGHIKSARPLGSVLISTSLETSLEGEPCSREASADARALETCHVPAAVTGLHWGYRLGTIQRPWPVGTWTWDLGQPGTTWDDLGRPGTTWDDLGKSGMTWHELGRAGTTWDDLGRPKDLQTSAPCCACTWEASNNQGAISSTAADRGMDEDPSSKQSSSSESEISSHPWHVQNTAAKVLWN